MICVDQRTVLTFTRRQVEKAEPELINIAAQSFGVRKAQVAPVHLAAILNVIELNERLRAFERPGWTVVATDIHGLPWLSTGAHFSHGTWAQHDACGSVQKITTARAECAECPPEPDSRTHRAKADQPHYLYLMRYGDYQKFGHGDANRVRAHLNAGCTAARVLRARHTEVVAAELAVKLRHRAQIVPSGAYEFPYTFGAGSEVLPRSVRVDLRRAFAETPYEDVTDSFKRPGATSRRA